jgi:3-oxoadipate enol-lactonase
MWDQQGSALADRFRIVRYDHRGHGASPVPLGPYELADLARDVLALLDRLSLVRVSFCGLSIGGMVGMWLGANAPERIDRLVLCATSSKPGNPETWIERAALVREQGTGAVADAVIGRWFTPEFAARERSVVDRTKAMILATPPEGYAGCCEALAEIDLEADLPRVKAKTLVIAPAEDPAFSLEHSERIVAGIPDARREILSPAAHLVNVERPDDVTRLIAEFLEEDR